MVILKYLKTKLKNFNSFIGLKLSNKTIFKDFDNEKKNVEKEKEFLVTKENVINENISKLKNQLQKLKDNILFINNKLKSNNKKISKLKQEINSFDKNIIEFKNKLKVENKNSTIFLELKEKQIQLNRRKNENLKKVNKLIQNNDQIFIKLTDFNEKKVLLNKKLNNAKNRLNKNKQNILRISEKISSIIYERGKSEYGNKKRRIIIFLSLPIFFFGVYFYVIARDRFYVDSNVVVRKSNSSNENSNGLSTLLGVGNQASREDARFLKIYLESPQILEDLLNVLDFREIYKKSGLDLYSGIKVDINKDKLYDFFKKQVDISYDDISGSLSIRTIGFKPKASYEFNLFLISKAEDFVNDLNRDIYLRQIEFVQRQVEINFKKLSEAQNRLQQFQNQTKTLNLDQEITLSTDLINSLENELIKARLELSLLKRQFVDQNAPEILYVNSQIEELTKQIKEQRNILIKSDGKNYVERFQILATLESNLSFWNDVYNSSLVTSEKTKLDSQKQQRFLAILSKPIVPQDQNYGWRHKWFLTFSLIILIGFFLTKFILGIADSHN